MQPVSAKSRWAGAAGAEIGLRPTQRMGYAPSSEKKEANKDDNSLSSANHESPSRILCSSTCTDRGGSGCGPESRPSRKRTRSKSTTPRLRNRASSISWCTATLPPSDGRLPISPAGSFPTTRSTARPNGLTASPTGLSRGFICRCIRLTPTDAAGRLTASRYANCSSGRTPKTTRSFYGVNFEFSVNYNYWESRAYYLRGSAHRGIAPASGGHHLQSDCGYRLHRRFRQPRIRSGDASRL